MSNEVYSKSRKEELKKEIDNLPNTIIKVDYRLDIESLGKYIDRKSLNIKIEFEEYKNLN